MHVQVHAEATVACAYAWEHEQSDDRWERVVKSFTYSLETFSNFGGGGEWFGYADADGKRTVDLIGGPYKGAQARVIHGKDHNTEDLHPYSPTCSHKSQVAFTPSGQ